VLPSVRFVRRTVLAALLVAILASVVLAGRSPSSPQSLSALFGGSETATPWGPLSTADRDVLIKLRQADLFDGSAGEQAVERGTDPRVRDAGQRIGAAHAQLDTQVLDAAAKLGVMLPNQPSDQQRVWLNSIAAAQGPAYDQRVVNLLRAAYGELLPLADGVRAGSQNALVRALAQQGCGTIDAQMDRLEATGLVNYSLLPPSTAPAARLTSVGTLGLPITLLLVLAAVLVAAVLFRGLAAGKPSGAERGLVGRTLDRALAAAGSARGRARATALRKRQLRENMVTTAELIAVLSPGADRAASGVGRPGPAGPGERDRAGERAAVPDGGQPVPRQRGVDPNRRPPKLGRGRPPGRGW
jgi:predicted outer membrane protein